MNNEIIHNIGLLEDNYKQTDTIAYVIQINKRKYMI